MPNNCDIPLEISDILDALPFYVMILDEKHHILQANRATWKHLGMKPEDIVGKYCPEVIHGVQEPWHACPLEEALETDRPVEREAIDENTGHWIRSAIYPTGKFTPDGLKIFFHMVSDITDRKRAEERAETARLALKTYVAHEVNAQEEQHKRIARELHDQTVQKVVFLGRQLEDLSLHQDLSPAVIEKLQKISDINNQIMENLRDFARDLRPPALDDLGLAAPINKLLLDFSDRTGIKSCLKVVGRERRLLLDAEVGLFRIVQEALRNIERHAKATEAVVTIAFRLSEARIDIKDNGIGFDLASVKENLVGSNHFGLVGMQERAELLGGKLEVESGPGRGTTVTVSVAA